MSKFKPGDTIEAIKDNPNYNIVAGQYYIVRDLKSRNEVYFNGTGRDGEGILAIDGRTCKAVTPLFYTEGLDNEAV